jgi:hypothetical protein
MLRRNDNDNDNNISSNSMQIVNYDDNNSSIINVTNDTNVRTSGLSAPTIQLSGHEGAGTTTITTTTITTTTITTITTIIITTTTTTSTTTTTITITNSYNL